MVDVQADVSEGPEGQDPSADPATDPATGPSTQPASVTELVRALQADRLWLLRQLDSGAWPEWRLDLAALERELGELLDRVDEGASTADER
jgi:hypothetical protein